MPERRAAIGKHLADLRRGQDLSQEDVARRAHLERKAVSRIETAAVVPTLDRILELADALGVSASEILAADPGPSPGTGDGRRSA